MLSAQKTIGFIKGGQLARMMIQALISYNPGMKVLVMDESDDCPCADLATECVQGESTSYDDVVRFGKRVDILILEFEAINIDALEYLEKEGVRVLSTTAPLRVIQDKGLQKQFLQQHDIPTAPFSLVENRQGLQELNPKLPIMLKSRRDGYDGGGVQKIANAQELAVAFDVPSVVEECVDIEREFSLIVGRDMHNTEFRYPLVEQFFHPDAHIVQFLAAPTEVFGDIDKQITAIGTNILKAFSGPGLWSIELFLNTKGTVLVNEIAPRVHNSGHHTIEGNVTSQFEQFIRIALGLPAGSTETIAAAVTMNILGPVGSSGAIEYQGLEKILTMPRVSLHLYGKKETRSFRKLGHVTAVGDSLDEAWEKIRQVERELRVVVKGNE